MVDKPLGDPSRLESVRRSGLMNDERDADFDRLTRLAARILGTPSAFVTILDDAQQLIKSAAEPDNESSIRQGKSMGLERSFCRFAIMSREPLLIDDARVHELVSDSPLVSEGLIAYAGVPLFAPDGEAIGAICAIDSKPRNWTEDDVQNLLVLSRSAAKLLENREEGLDNDDDHSDPQFLDLLGSVRAHFRAQDRYATVIAGDAGNMDLEKEAAARRDLVASTANMQRIFAELAPERREGALGDAVQAYLHAIEQRENTALAFSRGESDLGSLEGAIARLQDTGDRLQMVMLELDDWS